MLVFNPGPPRKFPICAPIDPALTGWSVANVTLAATCLELLGGLQTGCPGFSLHICSLAEKFLGDGDLC